MLCWFLPVYIVNRTAHFIRSSIATIATTPIYIDWIITPPKVKWRMKGSYPLAWMILSAVMLNMQFVGIYCGSSWRHVIPLHVKQQAHNQYLEWFLIPPKEPPDPVHSVNVSFDKAHTKHTTSPKNKKYLVNTNMVYSVSKRSITNSRNGTLID